MWRHPGRNQEHPLQPKLVRRLVREHQMADVGRVERPAENADARSEPPYPRIWPSPRNTYL